MYKQEEKLQGKDWSDFKAAAFLSMLLKNYTRLQCGRCLKVSSHQYQKGPGLSHSSYMLIHEVLLGFFSDLVGEGEILIVVYCTEILFMCPQGFQAVQEDTGSVEIGILKM